MAKMIVSEDTHEGDNNRLVFLIIKERGDLDTR